MTSTYTPRNRLGMQADGDNTNTYGDVFNAQVTTIIDVALDGWAYLTPSANFTLTTANGASDQARCRGLKYQAGSSAVTTTLPALEKLYLVWNASTAAQTFASSGGGATATVQPGEVVWIGCDATNVARSALLTMGGQRLQNLGAPTATTDAATKTYVDTAISSTAFSMGSFGVPIAPGDATHLLTNNGSTGSWTNVLPSLTAVGGSTASYPALNQNGANLEVKLADGSGFTGLKAGALTTLSSLTFASARSLSDVAVGSDIQAASSTTKANTPKSLADSAAFGSLTDAATIAWELATTGYNATVTLTASGHQIGAPTLNGGALFDGCPVTLELVQDPTGSRTVTWNSVWEWGVAGVPTLQTGASKRDLVFGIYRSSTGKIHANFRKGA